MTSAGSLLVTVNVNSAGKNLVVEVQDSGIGISAQTNVTPYVLVICMVPFLIMAAALPKIRKLGPDAPWRRSAAIGPYVDFFWRYGFLALALMAFVSVYRMGDVLALNLSKPMIKDLGYSLDQIGYADSLVALVRSQLDVSLHRFLDVDDATPTP